MGNPDQVLANYVKWYKKPNENRESLATLMSDFRARQYKEFIVREVQVEVSLKCNFSCIMCPRNEYDTIKNQQDMSLADYKTIVDKLPSTVSSVIVNGLGESSLNSDFTDMLKYTKSKGIRVLHYTNGSIFNMDNLAYIDELYFSLDSVDAVALQEMRVHSGNYPIIETLKQIKKEITVKKYGTTLTVNTTVNSHNWKNCDSLYDLCEEIGVDALFVQPTVNNFSYNTRQRAKMEEALQEDVNQISWGTIAHSYANKSYTFDVTIWYPRRTMKGFCVFGFSKLYIAVNGDIISCCRQVTTPLVFGNLLTENFEDIYHGEKMDFFRKAHADDEPLPFCERCSMGVPVE